MSERFVRDFKMDEHCKRVGYWMTEKKFRKLQFDKFVTLCRNAGIELVKIDFDCPLEDQGPFSVILHKLTDHITQVKEGTLSQIELFRRYTDLHREVIVIDPIDNILKLLDRRLQYENVKDCNVVESSYQYFIPSFVELTSSDVDENRRRLLEHDVRFPFVCKPTVSHACASSFPSAEKGEEMAIIFNEKGLADITTPCVAQTFVNHNARLFKIFVIGKQHFIIQRPSIRNFYDGNQDTIFFNSSDVSKSNSSSFLNQLDETDLLSHPLIEPDCRKMDQFVQGIQKKFGLDLLGIDVIIENDTGRYAVIDINAFPGYDGVPEFFNALLQLVLEKIMLASSLTAYSLPVASSFPVHFSTSNSYGHKVDMDESHSIYRDSGLRKNTISLDGTIASKHHCSFLPSSARYYCRSTSTPFSHPAFCVCYRNIAPSDSIFENCNRTTVITSFSFH